MTITILTSGKLSRAGFAHGFTTRLGGVSSPPFEALDFAVLRDAELLRENHARLAAAVGFEPSALHQAMQVHGAAVLVATGASVSSLAREADALVAEPKSGHAVAVRVADCVPVLVADPVSGRVSAIHAGWRGIEAGVVGATVRHLAEASNAGPASGYIVAIGPSIGPCCFEVDLDVGERIAKAVAADVIDRHAGDKVYVDLRMSVSAQLRAAGVDDESVDHIPGSGRVACTRCQTKTFYSYRRDGDASGRLIGVIVAR